MRRGEHCVCRASLSSPSWESPPLCVCVCLQYVYIYSMSMCVCVYLQYIYVCLYLQYVHVSVCGYGRGGGVGLTAFQTTPVNKPPTHTHTPAHTNTTHSSNSLSKVITHYRPASLSLSPSLPPSSLLCFSCSPPIPSLPSHLSSLSVPQHFACYCSFLL